MTFMEIFLCFLLVLVTASLSWSLRMLYKTGMIVLRVQDTLEESLEVIDERVDSIDKILEIPLFSDSPEIKQMRRDMISCREAMMEVAYSMSNSMDTRDTGSRETPEQ